MFLRGLGLAEPEAALPPCVELAEVLGVTGLLREHSFAHLDDIILLSLSLQDK